MMNSILGDVSFNEGWQKKEKIHIFFCDYIIKVNAIAYYETEKITREQEKFYNFFSNCEEDILDEIEKRLTDECGSIADARKKYTPSVLVIQQNGEGALLFDNNGNDEEGIAVTISLRIDIVNQDEVL